MNLEPILLFTLCYTDASALYCIVIQVFFLLLLYCERFKNEKDDKDLVFFENEQNVKKANDKYLGVIID